MHPPFNLLDELFLPCRVGAEAHDCSLRDALLQAHAIDELRDASPLVTVAVHRLMLAILYRVLQGPETERDWKQLWDAGRFPEDRLTKYFEQWHEQFDLFGSKRPFFQDAPFVAKARNGANQLVRELARGNNATLFDHTHECPPPALTPARAALALIAEQAFAVGGGKSETGYTSSAPAAGGVIVLVCGHNLFETLLLNLSSYKFAAKDLPAWERPARPTADKSLADGRVDYLTWQSRTIRLHPAHGVVSEVSYAAGRTYKPAGPSYDPMTAYKRDEKDLTADAKPIRLSESKELWRDSAAFFKFADVKLYKPSDNLSWMKSLKEEGCLPAGRAFTLAAFGLCTDKAKVNFWRHETLPLPLEYLTDVNLVTSLKDGIALAETVGQSLRIAVAHFAKLWLTFDTQKSPDKDRQWQIVDGVGADKVYWSRLEGPFREFLVALPTNAATVSEQIAHRHEVADGWYRMLRRTALAIYRETVEFQQANARRQRAVLDGEAYLRRELGKIGKPYRPAKEVMS